MAKFDYWSSSTSTSGTDNWEYNRLFYGDPTIKIPKEPELKDEVLSTIAKKYFNKNRLVWFMNNDKTRYNKDIIDAMRLNYGLSIAVYDPVHGDHRYEGIPSYEGWHEGLITDCLEYCDDYIIKANVIKFALTCLVKSSSLRRLTIIVQKNMDMEKAALIDLAYFANAKNVWEPAEFNKVEDRICIALR